MIDERRYVLIPFADVTQEMIDHCIQTSIETLRHVDLGNGDQVLLKWRNDKPIELWSRFPVYSQFEMIDILKNDKNVNISSWLSQ